MRLAPKSARLGIGSLYCPIVARDIRVRIGFRRGIIIRLFLRRLPSSFQVCLASFAQLSRVLFKAIADVPCYILAKLRFVILAFALLFRFGLPLRSAQPHAALDKRPCLP